MKSGTKLILSTLGLIMVNAVIIYSTFDEKPAVQPVQPVSAVAARPQRCGAPPSIACRECVVNFDPACGDCWDDQCEIDERSPSCDQRCQ